MKQKYIDNIIRLLYTCDADTLKSIDRAISNIIEGSRKTWKIKKKKSSK